MRSQIQKSVGTAGRRCPAPEHVGDKHPRQTGFGGAEFKTYKLSVRLVGLKLSDNDSDIHVEVRGLFAPGESLVREKLAELSEDARRVLRDTLLEPGVPLTPAPTDHQLCGLGVAAIPVGAGGFRPTGLAAV
jgi:hypothetical protein